MKHTLQRVANVLGYRIQRIYPADLRPETVETIERVRPYTVTSPEAVAALCAAVEHVTTNGLPGAVTECGVWKGGSMMAAALALLRLGDADRELYLYDTFAGMPPPTGRDTRLLDGRSAFDPDSMNLVDPFSAGEVRRVVESTGYPSERIHLVEGRVEETIPGTVPEEIAILRLDTDWYESTRHELVHLFPRLVSGGILIVDDYGHWAGARDAVDEYLEETGTTLFLSRVDYTVRLAVKP